MNIASPLSVPPWVPHVPVPVNLRRMFLQASFVGCGDIRTVSATDSSTACRPGSLFAAIRGTKSDGHQYIREAIQNGASALLVEHPQADVAVPQCIVPDVRRAYAELCQALMAHPARHLGLAGVTGTNGKTTTTWLIRSILNSAGNQTGILGTIENHNGIEGERSNLTTSDPATLARWLAAMVSQKSTHVALEISSHALDQRRTAGTLLDAAIISNISQDHFDYHQTFAAYRKSKIRIFDYLKPAGVAIVNLDDPGSRSCLPEAPKRVMTYSLQESADVSATILESSLAGSRFRLSVGTSQVIVETSLIGLHNVSNCLAAAAAALHFGLTLAEIARGIAALDSVPGRMESIDCGQPYRVFVDYAHTEDALRNCIRALKPQTAGRLLCVMGAGGDRDRTKRPLLGKAAAEADLAIVTSDNPRSENPQRIIEDVCAGFSADHRPAWIEADRELAIRWALQHACPGDSILIAGKGHETEQIIGADRRHFDDRETARACLAELYPEAKVPPTHLKLRNPLRV